MLKNAGADVDRILKLLTVNCSQSKLSSIRSELDSLELLSRVHELAGNHAYEMGGGDHVFKTDKIAYEIKTLTWDISIMKNIFAEVYGLGRNYEENGYHTQVIYGVKPTLLRQRIGQGPVRSSAEIMYCLIPYRPLFARKIIDEIRKAKAGLEKYDGRKVAIIDVRHTPLGLRVIMEDVKRELKSLRALSGVMILHYETIGTDLKNGFIVIPSNNSSRPISPDFYRKISLKFLIDSDWVFSTPVKLHHDELHPYNIFRRESDGALIINDSEVCKSLTTNDCILFNGFIGSPDNIRCIEFGGENRSTRVYFK